MATNHSMRLLDASTASANCLPAHNQSTTQLGNLASRPTSAVYNEVYGSQKLLRPQTAYTQHPTSSQTTILSARTDREDVGHTFNTISESNECGFGVQGYRMPLCGLQRRCP